MARRTTTAFLSSKAKDERLEARISPTQKRLFQQAAALQGRTLTDFVIASVHEAAVRTVEQMHAIRLTAEESQNFAKALLNPREPNDRLKAAARRYMARVGN